MVVLNFRVIPTTTKHTSLESWYWPWHWSRAQSRVLRTCIHGTYIAVRKQLRHRRILEGRGRGGLGKRVVGLGATSLLFRGEGWDRPWSDPNQSRRRRLPSSPHLASQQHTTLNPSPPWRPSISLNFPLPLEYHPLPLAPQPLIRCHPRRAGYRSSTILFLSHFILFCPSMFMTFSF